MASWTPAQHRKYSATCRRKREAKRARALKRHDPPSRNATGKRPIVSDAIVYLHHAVGHYAISNTELLALLALRVLEGSFPER